LVGFSLSWPLVIIFNTFLNGKSARPVFLGFLAIAEHESRRVLVLLLALHGEGGSWLRERKPIVGLVESEDLKPLTFAVLSLIGQGREGSTD
jgi:hypothetical protein